MTITSNEPVNLFKVVVKVIIRHLNEKKLTAVSHHELRMMWKYFSNPLSFVDGGALKPD